MSSFYKYSINLKNTPKGIRTPAASVKGMCPRPLDDGGIFACTLEMLALAKIILNFQAN